MYELFLKQISLIGALSAIVLAVLWPHFKKILKATLSYPTIRNISTFLSSSQSSEPDEPTKYSTDDHPRLSGRTLRRMASQKKTVLGSALYGDSEVGYGKSSLDGGGGQLSFSSQQNPSYHHLRSESGPLPGSMRDIGGRHAVSVGPTSSLPLTIFSGFTVALIFYTMTRLLTARLGRIDAEYSADNERPSTKFEENPDERANNKASVGLGLASRVHDFKFDKSRLHGLNREQRARRLILHHGSKNVALAMKFLVRELEKQKQLLISGRANSDGPICDPEKDYANAKSLCTCSCHPES